MPGGREKIGCQMPGGREFFLCKCPGVSRGGMVRVGIERDISHSATHTVTLKTGRRKCRQAQSKTLDIFYAATNLDADAQNYDGGPIFLMKIKSTTNNFSLTFLHFCLLLVAWRGPEAWWLDDMGVT